MAGGLPPYTSDQLAGSHMKTVEVERIYYYALRKADQSLTVRLPWLNHFFKGKLSNSDLKLPLIYPQFPDLFPLQLHSHSKSRNHYKIIENIVFINNPDISYNNPEDVQRFRRLTGIENLYLSRDAARFHISEDHCVLYNVQVKEAESNGDSPPFMSSYISQRKRRMDDAMRSKEQDIHDAEPINSMPSSVAPRMYPCMTPLTTKVDTNFLDVDGPAMIFLASRPTKQEWTDITAAAKSGFALTGTAAMGRVGPIVGLMDIGECDDSYLFRVALPGVKRDERHFSCEVDASGKVLIRGVTTTGEKSVYRYSQVFEMQSRNLCPPGRFSLSFQLPGPVDPQQFTGNFGTDGILEGIVMKENSLVDK
ncbi:alpha-crystallin domain-containing protein 22.3-like isoform X2 [Mangifera indica]|nr:alpha-crystallin domain-containing protein 22.3-like isoform X2 [Mangifera indica]